MQPMLNSLPVVPGYKILRVKHDTPGKYLCVICSQLSEVKPDIDEAILFPGGRKVRLKTITPQSPEEIEITLKGAVRSNLFPGGVLLDKSWPVKEHKEALLLYDGYSLPREKTSPFGGISPDFNAEGFIGKAKLSTTGFFAHLQLSHPYPMIPGMRVWVSDRAKKRRSFLVFYPGSVDPVLLRRFNGGARRRPGAEPRLSEIYGRLLHTLGFLHLPPIFLNHEFKDAQMVGSWCILKERLSIIKKSLIKLSSQPGGMKIQNLNIKDYPYDLLVSVLDYLCKKGELIQKNNWCFPPGNPVLSPFHRSWLERVQKAGKSGFRIRDAGSIGAMEALEALGRSGLILGGNELWFSYESVETLANSILEKKSSGDRILIADVRDRITGNRSVALELLKILEADGRLLKKNDGFTRVVM